MKRVTILAAMAAASAALAFSFVQGIKVTVDGQAMTGNAIMHNGSLYLPAADVAKAMGRTLKADAPGKSYSLIKAGGANAGEGVTGKPGETMFNGATRLTVNAPEVEGGKLTLNMEVRNAEQKTKTYYLTLSESKYTLLDADGNSLEADSVSESFPDLDPGSMKKFTVKFDVSRGFSPVRLVVRLNVHVPGNPRKAEFFRVALKD
jgi:hypothetical protein